MMPANVEEIAGMAGLKPGTFFLSAGQLYRVERYTKLRIYVKKYPLYPLAMDMPGVGISGTAATARSRSLINRASGNQEAYLEVPSYAISNSDGDGQARADRWVKRVTERVMLLPETDEAGAIQRVHKAAAAAAPITKEIEVARERHRAEMRLLVERRQTAIVEALK
jgi:hypothetical protein